MTQRTLKFSAVIFAFSLAHVGAANQALAQRSDEAKQANSDHNEWYYGSEDSPKKTIAQQKAELKAQQRMDRLASQRWYGFVPGRPTATGMTFTTMYSPAWTRPGGQPFAWYTGYQQPIVYNAPAGWRYW